MVLNYFLVGCLCHSNKRIRSLIPFYAERNRFLNSPNNENKGILLPNFIDSKLLIYTRYKVGHYKAGFSFNMERSTEKHSIKNENMNQSKTTERKKNIYKRDTQVQLICSISFSLFLYIEILPISFTKLNTHGSCSKVPIQSVNAFQ